MNLSVIITTYNWSDALALVLQSLVPQMPGNSEILIADDGSSEQHQQAIKRMIATHASAHVPIHHIWHEDQGFRAAAIRNKAITKAQGAYCIFLDGDSIPCPGFITRHLQLRDAKVFVAGNRLLLSESWTKVLLQSQEDISQYGIAQWLMAFFQKKVNRLTPLLYLPGQQWRIKQGLAWQNVKTCNFGVWRQALVDVNGFDESFVGWGYEDSELAVRLLRHGLKHKTAKFAAPIFHLWHPENDRGQHDENYQKLLDRISGAEPK